MGLLDFEKFAPERQTSGDPHGVKLREAVRDAGRGQCAICAVLDAQERARLYWLAYEGLSDPGLREKLKASKGLCRRHFRLLYRAVSEQTYNTSGVADLMRALLDADRDALRAALAEAKAGRRAKKAVAGLRTRSRCPLCDDATAATDRKIQTLISELGNESFRQVYVSSPGLLCRPHLLAALNKEPDEAVVVALLHKHLKTLEADDEELAEFIRKRDYRFSSEAKGAEQDAPRRTVDEFIGTWPR